MSAIIYCPAKTSMQSGRGNTRHWFLEHEQTEARRADPLMGWQGGTSTATQIRLKFPTREAAIAYAEKHGLAYTVLPVETRALKLQSYADNFR